MRGIQGERKQVTVLFADIKDSTNLIDELDPEQAAALLEPALQTMIDAVHHYEGTVNRVQGDGIMALFGAPLAHEDNAVRATYAALDMQDATKRVPQARIAIRVGLHAGEVLVRSLNNDLSIDYDAIGSTVHLAARMERLAPPGSIYCTGEVVRQAGEFVKVETAGEIAVQGITHQVKAFRIVGYGSARTRWEASAARGLSPFVGRAAELTTLHVALKRAQNGEGQAVTIVGDPGSGKTRLVHEFSQSGALRNCTSMRNTATPRDKETPYLAISKMLRAWLDLSDHQDPEQIKQRISERLLRSRGGPDFLRPVLHTLLGVSFDDAEWEALEPSERRRRITPTLVQFFKHSAADRPTLLWFEDVQWTDIETVDFMQRLVQQVAASPILIIATYRSGYEHSWTAVPNHETLRIEPLAEVAASALVTTLLGADPGLRQLATLITRRTEGIPLFIEETIREVADGGAIRGRPGAYTLVRDLHSIKIPATIHDVLTARIDRLTPDEKTLLQIGSAIGRDVPIWLLQSVSGLGATDLDEMLDRLGHAEFIRVSRVGASPRLAFKHVLIQDVAYASLLFSNRRALHGEILDAIREHFSGSLQDHVEELAYHALRSESWRDAAAHCWQAGRKALDVSSFGQARSFLSQALEALGHLPESREATQFGIDVRLKQREIFGAMAEYDQLQRVLGEAEILATSIDDKRRLAQVSVAQNFAFNTRGDLDGSVIAGVRARALALEIGDSTLGLAASHYLAQAYLWRGDMALARDTLASNVGEMQGPMRYERIGTATTTSVLLLGMLGASHAYLGDFSDATSFCRQAREIADEGLRPADIALAYWYSGFVWSHQGDVEAAMNALRRGFDICRAKGIMSLVPIVGTSLGYAYVLANRAAEGIDLLHMAATTSTRVNFHYGEAWPTAHLALASLWDRRADDAAQFAQRALELGRRHRFRAVEATGLRLLGSAMLSSATPDLEAAGRHLRRAHEISVELCLQPEQAHCLSELARLHRARSNAIEADQARAHALTLYQRLGMKFWANRVDLPASL